MNEPSFFLKHPYTEESTNLQRGDIFEFTFLNLDSDEPMLALQILRDMLAYKICWEDYFYDDSITFDISDRHLEGPYALSNLAAEHAWLIAEDYGLGTYKRKMEVPDMFQFIVIGG